MPATRSVRACGSRAQLVQLGDYTAIQGRMKRHDHGQQGHVDARDGDLLTLHRVCLPEYPAPAP